MNSLRVNLKDTIAFITLDRGRFNAINAGLCNELQQMVQNIEQDEQTSGIILTGKEGFFSAGLDLIELYDYNEAQIKEFWSEFMTLVSTLVSFKKPLIAAINGHSPAGGCVLAICADYRVMTDGKYVIGLNEIPVGLQVPESIFHLYSFWIGTGAASRYLLEGRLMSPADALKSNLIDELVPEGTLLTAADRQMKKYIQFNRSTWQQSKLNLRRELIGQMNADQSETLENMLQAWWSPHTRSILKTIIENLTRNSAGKV